MVACNATDGAVLWKFRPDQHVYNWIGSIQSGSLLFSDALGGTYRLRLKDARWGFTTTLSLHSDFGVPRIHINPKP